MSAPLNLPTRAFAAVVTATGTTLLAAVAYDLAANPAVKPITPAAALLLALVVAGELLPVRWTDRQGGIDLTSSWSYAGALLLMGHWRLALLAIATASALGDAKARKPLSRIGFNAAQLGLSLGAGAAILHTTVGLAPAPIEQAFTAKPLAALAAAGLGVLVTNTVLTRTVIGLQQGRSLARVARTLAGPHRFGDAADLALAPLYALTASTSAWLLPLVLILSWRLQGVIRHQVREEHRATHDGLTGLLTADALSEELREALAAPHPTPLGFVLMRLANLEDLVLAHGTVVADAILQELAGRLHATALALDRTARVEHDTFALLVHVADDAAVDTAMYRLATALRAPVDIHGAIIEVDVHLGASAFPADAVDAAQLMDRARAALYQASESPDGVCRHRADGRRRVSWLGSELLIELRQAIEEDQLHLVYQPVMDLGTGTVRGAEALVRWDHPTRGAIAPDAFIPLAEQTGAITIVTDFVLDEAAAQLARWRDQGRDLHLAVNVSACDLVDPVFADHVVARLDHHRLDHGCLELELTENAMSRDWDISQSVLQRLHAHGVHLAVDDFGTGYSSLTHLKDVPFDTLKVDRSFISEFHDSASAAVIVRTVLDLAKGIGARALAEGIETEEVKAELAGLGCDAGQGYLFSAPMTEVDFDAWLESGSRTLCASA